MKPQKAIEIRKKLGLNQTQMGRLIHHGRVIVNRYENGISPITDSIADLYKFYDEVGIPEFKKKEILQDELSKYKLVKSNKGWVCKGCCFWNGYCVDLKDNFPCIYGYIWKKTCK